MFATQATADFILYSTDACHLCDLAKAMILPLASQNTFTLSVVDVSETDALMDRYGIRIPVLHQSSTGAELNWPFDSDDLRQFLNAAF